MKICLFYSFRIIEIAGGRELYSQSRTKAARKLRHNNTHKHNLRNKIRSISKDSVDYAEDTLTNEVNYLNCLISCKISWIRSIIRKGSLDDVHLFGNYRHFFYNLILNLIKMVKMTPLERIKLEY